MTVLQHTLHPIALLAFGFLFGSSMYQTSIAFAQPAEIKSRLEQQAGPAVEVTESSGKELGTDLHALSREPPKLKYDLPMTVKWGVLVVALGILLWLVWRLFSDQARHASVNFFSLVLLFATSSLATGAAWLLLLDYAFVSGKPGEPLNASEFGDAAGLGNSLFSALAFAGVITAIVLQTLELKAQRKEMEYLRGEHRNQIGIEVALAELSWEKEKYKGVEGVLAAEDLLKGSIDRLHQRITSYEASERSACMRMQRETTRKSELQKFIKELSEDRQHRQILRWLSHADESMHFFPAKNDAVSGIESQSSQQDPISFWKLSRFALETADRDEPEYTLHLLEQHCWKFIMIFRDGKRGLSKNLALSNLDLGNTPSDTDENTDKDYKCEQEDLDAWCSRLAVLLNKLSANAGTNAHSTMNEHSAEL